MAANVSSGGALLRPEEESEAEVRREDQENINKFARLNARLHEVRNEVSVLKVRLRVVLPVIIIRDFW